MPVRKFKEIRPQQAGKFAKGGVRFLYNGVRMMSLAGNPTPYTAVNLETGDLTTLKDRDDVEVD